MNFRIEFSSLSKHLLTCFFAFSGVLLAQVPNPGDFGSCFIIADEGNAACPGSGATCDDLLFVVNPVTGQAQTLGFPTFANGAELQNIESIAFDPRTQTLYAFDGGTLVSIDWENANGASVPTATVGSDAGTAGGILGNILLDDIDSMAFDFSVTPPILYGVQRRDSPAPDVLVQINVNTGQHIPEAFGPSLDYVPVGTTANSDNVDDIAIDCRTGVMYGIINNSDTDTNDELAEINKSSGAINVITPAGVGTGVFDMEGLSFLPDGSLHGTTGNNGGAAAAGTQNSFLNLGAPGDADFGTAVNLQRVVDLNNNDIGFDFEALACLFPPPVIAVDFTPNVIPRCICDGDPYNVIITISNGPSILDVTVENSFLSQCNTTVPQLPAFAVTNIFCEITQISGFNTVTVSGIDCAELPPATDTASGSLTPPFDILDPVLIGVPASIELSCDAPLPAVANVTATDACTVVTTYMAVTNIPADLCGGVIDRIWTATDPCGNTAVATQKINLVDELAPAFANVPANANVACDAVPAVVNPIITDNCTTPDIDFNETRINGNCPFKYTLQRVWTAVDACGNAGAATQLVTVSDTTAPTFTGVPANAAASCDNIQPVVNPTANDNCSGPITPTFVETRINGNCPFNYTLQRVWTATDACANSASATQIVTVTDIEAPVFSGVPANANAACDNVPAPATPTATDNCTPGGEAGIPVTLVETRINGNCPYNYTLQRVWTATDDCGNTVSATQLVTVTDTSAPTFSTVPANITVECDVVPAPVAPTANDNCSGPITPVLNETRVDGNCPANYTLQRTWTATDECGNSNRVTQTVTVRDTMAPVVTVPPDIAVPCDAVPAPGNATATDLCTEGLLPALIETRVNGNCPDNYTLLRVWSVTDPCGNTGSATQVVTVTDTAPPTFTNVPADVTAECDNVPAAGTPTVADNCATVSANLTETRTNGNCPFNYTLARVWVAADSCGNVALATQIVTVVDTTPPTLSGVPADVTAECDDIPAAPTVSAADNCTDGEAGVPVNATETRVNGDCLFNYTLVRVWSAMDECGNAVAATQLVNVVDTTAPVLTGVPPASIVAECSAVPGAATVSATDNCSTGGEAGIPITLSETRTDGNCPFNYTLVRVWSASDDCGNTIAATQTVVVSDTTPPVLSDDPADITAECSAVPGAATVSATDNCSTGGEAGIPVTLTETRVDGNCPFNYTLVRVWTASDECSNMASVTQNVTVADTTPPVLSDDPADITAECDAVPAAVTISATDNCSTGGEAGIPVTLTETRVDGNCPFNYTLVRVWTASDDCSNMASVTQNVTVADTTPPVLSDDPADITAECSAIPTAVAISATDNCSTGGEAGIPVTLTETRVDGNCPFNYTLVRVWTASDDCSNMASVTQNVTVADTTPPVLSDDPADITAECSAIPTAVTISATDNCSTGGEAGIPVTLTETRVDGNCPFNYTLVRVWTASDDCSNMASVTQNVTVADTTPPVLSDDPADITAECDAVPAAVTISATDNCSTGGEAGIPVTLTETRVDGDCPFNYTLVRVWTASDECSNMASVTQNVTVADTTPPVLSDDPADITAECDAVPAAVTISATDNCSTGGEAGIPVTLTETRVDGNCPFNYTLVRVWTASDECSNMASVTQNVTVADTTPPVLSDDPADITAECDAVPAAVTISATDNCSTGGEAGIPVTLTETRVDGNCPFNYTLVRVWTASDECSNMASVTQNVTVADTSPPVLSDDPADITAECDAVPAAVTISATDNCSTGGEAGIPVILNETRLDGDCPFNYNLVRVWTASDECGNIASVTQNVTVADTTPPVLVGVPDDTTAECDNIPTEPTVSATDNCSTGGEAGIPVNFSESRTDGDCPFNYTLTRTWTATDDCGNTSTQTQSIAVNDTTPPALGGVPADATVECSAVPNPPLVTAIDNCTMQVGEAGGIVPSFMETRTDGSCPDSYMLIRVWSAVDECGNRSTETQMLSVVDTTSPELICTTELVLPGDDDCEATIPAIDVSVLDNCSPTNSIIVTQVPAAGTVTTGILDVVVTATDACGNSTQCTVKVTIGCNDPLINIQKTVYLGHDGGVSCPGSEIVVAGPGVPVTYCFEVNNPSNVNITDTVISDTTLGMPPINIGLVEDGQQIMRFYEASTTGPLVNTAEVNGFGPDVTPVSDDDTAAVETPPAAAIDIVKTAGIASDGEIFTINGPSPVSFTFTVTNSGDSHLSGIIIVDDAGTPADNSDDITVDSTSCPDLGNLLPPGGQVQCAITLPIDATTTNTAGTVGVPSDSTGVPYQGVSNPMDSDDAVVEFLPLLSLGNLVFEDHNNNGIRDPGEPPIGGVTLSLWTDDDGDGGPDTDTGLDATTAPDGTYLFENLLIGDYVVQVDPANFAAGAPLENLSSSLGDTVAPDPDENLNDTDDGTPVDGLGVLSGAISLTPGDEPVDDGDADPDSNLTLDFGFVEPLSLGDLVFFDPNNNGVLDATEMGIAGVTISLWLDTNGDGAPDTDTGLDAITDGAGNYLFEELNEGDYIVQIEPENFSFGGPLAGLVSSSGNNVGGLSPDPDDNVENDDNGFSDVALGVLSQPITLSDDDEPTDDTGPNTGTSDEDSSNETLDFGFWQPMTVGDLVFLDTNKDGVKDLTEPGIQSVLVSLWRDTDGDGLPDEDTGSDAVTDSDGRYFFNNLVPGDYVIQVDPSNFAVGAPLDGFLNSPGEPDPDDDDNTTENGLPIDPTLGVLATAVTLTPDSEPVDDGDTDPNSNLTVDFGFFPEPLSLGNTVWLDLDNSGTRDATETGIAGVALSLWKDNDADGAPDEDTGLDQTTGVDGTYLFDGLDEGDYIVQLDPSNFAPGGPLEGHQTSTGNDVGGSSPDPDDDLDDDDNGDDAATFGVFSKTVSLAIAGEPVGEAGSSGSAEDDSSNLTVDFGLFVGATIGDFVWFDANADGIQDSGEQGLLDVTVNLLDADGNFLEDTTTDANGAYAFTELDPGTYIVEFVAPPGADFSPQGATSTDQDSDADPATGRAAPVTVSSGDNILTIDAGISLREIVTKSTNGVEAPGPNGETRFNYTIILQNPSAIPNGPVTVVDSLPAFATYISDDAGGALNAEGAFEYTAATLGGNETITINVLVEVDPAELTSGLVNTALVTIGANEYMPTEDVARLGDTVWFDENKNGLLDSGEALVDGVTVNLTTADGIAVGSTTTDANGNYGFIVPAGDYVVTFVPPAGTEFTSLDTGLDDTIDSDPDPVSGEVAVTLGAGEDIPTIDAGLISDDVVSKTVGQVVSSGGTLQFEYVITVENPSALTKGPVVITDPLPAWASYVSDNVGGTVNAAGAYEAIIPTLGPNETINAVVVVQVNEGATIESIENVASITVGTSTQTVSNLVAQVGDTVWQDANEDGIRDADEPGVSGITVNLLDLGGNLIGNTTTDTTGMYGFIVPPGDYIVEFVPPAGIDLTIPDATDDASDSDADQNSGRTPVITLAAGDRDPTVDAGIISDEIVTKTLTGVNAPNDIGNAELVYTIQIVNPIPVAKGPVTIIDPLPSWATYISDNGGGAINDLGQVEIVVNELPPSGTVEVEIVVEVTGPLSQDSLVNTATITIGENTYTPSAEAAALGSTVWFDSDGDGVQGPAEDGIAGVTVDLFDDTGTIVASTVTDSNGDYQFIVPAGTYTVDFGTVAGNFFPSIPDAGAEDVDSDADPVDGVTPPVTLNPGDRNPDIDAGFTVVSGDKEVGTSLFISPNGNAVFDYIITVQNPSGLTLNQVVVTDPLPEWAAYLSDNSGGEINPAGEFQVIFPSIGPGITKTVSVQIEVVTPMSDDTLVNMAVITIGDTMLTPTSAVASVGNFIFNDTNANGIQDTDEMGIPGVQATIVDTNGNDIARVISDETGLYQFIVPPGGYIVQITPPPNSIITTPDQGAEDVDSDVNSDGISPLVQLGANQRNPDIDAGIILLSSIGDRVFNDINANGLQDAGEPGVAGATVTLLDAAGAAIGTPQVTVDDGMYLFTGLVPGMYAVQVDPPAGATFTSQDAGDETLDSDVDATGRTATIDLPAGVNNLDIDAGILTLASIGDLVFNDLNANGLQDSGEPGVAGATVTLLDASGAAIGTPQVTVDDGMYLFTGLVPGTYAVQVDPPAGATFTTQDAGDDALDSDVDATGRTATIDLAAGVNNPDIDAGIITLGSIGDLVFNDINANGLQDSGEPGVAGATVTLLDAAGAAIGSPQVTADDGLYLFTGLIPGTYAVQVDPPAGATFTSQDAGDETLDSDVDATGRTATIDLSPGVDNVDIDAGILTLASIGDLIFNDRNANGLQDAGEPGVQGATVTLLDATGTPVGTAQTTGPDGTYLFTGLVPGMYAIQVTPPAGLIFTSQDAGDDTLDSDVDANGLTATFALDVGVNNLDIDAGTIGLVPGLSVNKTVINGTAAAADCPGGELVTNTNGATVTYCIIVQNTGDTDLANVLVEDAAIGFSQTVALLAPTEQVVFAVPSAINGDLVNTASATGTPANPQGETIIGLTPPNDTDTTEVNEVAPASIGDYVFIDLNTNGIQEVGDAGFNNVRVTLLDDAGNPVGAPQTTGSDGRYLFDGLPAGTYSVQFELPATNQFFTPQGIGGDPNIDSDADPTTGISPPVTVNLGDTIENIDAGVFERDLIPVITLVTIGDFVFQDNNANNLRDPGDPGIANVTVNLYDAQGNFVGSTMTDNTGAYALIVPTGAYTVEFIPPPGASFVVPNVGTDDLRDSDADPVTGRTSLLNFTDPGAPSNLGVDAGFVAPPTYIGDFVFADTNLNGVQDEGETGVGGVTIVLQDTDGNTLQTTQSDANGMYRFEVREGNYRLFFDTSDLAPGFTFTAQNVGGDDELDSDANPSNGLTPFTGVLAAGSNNLSFDTGVVPPASIGDLVWLDSNNNGQPDEKFPTAGIEGAVVDLYEIVGGVRTFITSVTTGPDGSYRIDGLPPGMYSVEINTTNGAIPNVAYEGFTTPSVYDFTLTPGLMIDTADFGLEPVITAIELERFNAVVSGNGVALEWITGAEIDNLGFFLYRAPSVDGPRTMVFDSLILADNGNIGAAYTGFDPNGSVDDVYFLIDLDNNLVTTEHGPFGVRRDLEEDTVTTLGSSGLTLIRVEGADQFDVFENGQVVPALVTKKGLLVRLAADSHVALQPSVSPVRMEVVKVTPNGDSFELVSVPESGILDLSSPAAADRYLVAGNGGSLYTIDLTDRVNPVHLEAPVLGEGTLESIYLSIKGGTKVFVVEESE